MPIELKGLRILIADDSEPIRRSLQAILAPIGLRIRTAENGQQALEMARVQPGPQLILSDIEMPIMGGIDFCKNLKSYLETKDIPVIFLSTLDDSKSVMAGMRVGAADYISKRSFSEENLVRVITRVVEPILRQTPTSPRKPHPTAESSKSPGREKAPDRVKPPGTDLDAVRHMHLGMFAKARIGLLVYSLSRELLFINEYASRKLNVEHGALTTSNAQDLLKQAIPMYEDGIFDRNTFIQGMSKTGTGIQYRLEILVNQVGEATGVILLIE